MSTAAPSVVSDTTDLREIAAVIRACAKRNGDDDERRVNASLEAVAAELETTAGQSAGQTSTREQQISFFDLKARQLRNLAWTGDMALSTELLRLAKKLESGAGRLKGAARPTGGAAGRAVKRKGRWTRFAPGAVAMAMAIGLAAIVWAGEGWFSSLGESRIGATKTAGNPPASMPPASPPAAPPQPTAPPVTGTARPPPPKPAMGVVATRLAAEVLARAQRVVKPEAASEPRPRRVTRITAAVEAPSAIGQLDLSRGHVDAAASPPPIDAASVQPPTDTPDLPPDRPPPPPDARQAALPPVAPRSLSIGGPVPLVSAAPALASGLTTPPESIPATALNSRECVSYTSDRSMSGRSEPVQGLACRDVSGRWQRQTEVPRSN
jgi:hypothetical protein